MGKPLREIVRATPTLLTSKEFSSATHADPYKKGGYLLIQPGKVPEIVLDGLATEQEQRDAETRCLKELESLRTHAQTGGETLADQGEEVEAKRRDVVRLQQDLAVTRHYDPILHADPQRRGGYLLLLPGRVPEIVLDGLATDEEQKEAEARCRRMLQVSQRSEGTLKRLQEAILNSGRPVGVRPAEAPRPKTPAQLGQRLLKLGLLSDALLQKALQQQKKLPPKQPVRRLGSLLILEGHLSGAQVARALGEQRGVQPVSTGATRVDAVLQPLFPLDALVRLEAAPLFLAGKTLALAMVDPHLQDRVLSLQVQTHYTLRVMQASQWQVRKLLDSMRKAP